MNFSEVVPQYILLIVLNWFFSNGILNRMVRVFSVLLALVLLALLSAPNIYAQHYGDSYSDSQYDDNTYTNPGPLPSPSANNQPGAFGLNAPIVSCTSSNTPNIRLRWTQSWLATDYVFFYKDQVDGITRGGWILDTSRVFDFTGGNQVIPGHYYSFVIRARNNQGYKDSNTSPYSPSVPNGWSDQLYGWTQFPSCVPPGNFSLSHSAYCPAVGTSRIHLTWTPASGANSYTAYYRQNGYSPEIAAGSTNGLAYDINSPTLSPGTSYQFLIAANNISGTTFSDNAWSDPVSVDYCSNPTVNLTIDTGDIVKTIDSGSSIQLNYTVTNAYTCTTTANPAMAGVTTPWTNTYPANTAISNPGSTSGSVTMTLYNDSTHTPPGGSYQFTLSCNNNQITGLPSAATPVSKTVTVNVTQTVPPFIQTTQGDVHSNKNINVPDQIN